MGTWIVQPSRLSFSEQPRHSSPASSDRTLDPDPAAGQKIAPAVVDRTR